MYKNNNTYTIVYEEGTIEILLQKYLEGAQVVFVVQKSGVLLGGVTRGDIRRLYKNNKTVISFMEIVNTNIKRITFIDEEQVFKDAKEVFDHNNKIHNIPVVNKTGKILFQIDRFAENIFVSQDIRNILDAAKGGAIECFFESDDIKEIILTGSDRESLYKTEQIFYQYCNELILKKNMTIKIVDNIKEFYNLSNNVKIISLSEFGPLYINKINKYQMDVITAKDLGLFAEYKKIQNFDKDILNNFIEIFEYKAIGFYSLNKYINTLAEMLNDCNIKCIYLKENKLYKNYLEDNNVGIFDVLLFSGNKEEYCEKSAITELIQDISLILNYRQITGNVLVQYAYIEKYANYLYKLQDMGFSGFLQEINSYWKKRVNNKIKEKGNLEVITKWEDISFEKNYIIAYESAYKERNGNLVLSVRDILEYICEEAVYKIIIQKCKNVFVFTDMFTNFNIEWSERNRDNYIRDINFFEDNFTKNICGKDKCYLTEVIQDRSNCRIIELNNGYIKFSSNYHSKYFNTDLYGNRIVEYEPKEHIGTIWLVGNCHFNGYAVEDKHTFASLLQKKISSEGYKYRVVDLSCDGGRLFNLFNKIFERYISFNDIIIVLTGRFFIETGFINIDYEEINNSFKGKIWFWNGPGHMGASGNEFLAKKTFEIVKQNMYKSVKDYKFCLNGDLELMIKNYINGIKNNLSNNKIYKRNCYNTVSGYLRGHCKIGAIVMNCNPFTYGHQYLIDTASRLVDLLYIFVVEEDKSVFCFEKRFSMVKEGTKQYDNVIVLPSGNFMISSVTFPGYFLKEMPTEESYDDFLDLKIFTHYIAPGFAINFRFVGEEPLDKVTAQYNYDMKEILNIAGITVIEIPRKKIGDEFISATKVRKLLKEGNYNLLKNYIPETTMKYL